MKREQLGPELANIAEGAALVEAADSGLVRSAFEDLTHATGGDLSFRPDELHEIGDITGHIVDTAQGLVLPAATILILWAGMKKMFEGFDQKSKS